MIVTTSQALEVARQLGASLPPHRSRRIMKRIRAEVPITCSAIDDLNSKMNAAGLVLPSAGKRLDHRGECIKVVAERKRLILDQLRSAEPTEIEKRAQMEFSPG